jgi:quinol monooxygenase YgiN
MSYVMVARWRPREGAAEKIEAILRELATAIRGEPGNVQFTVLRGHDDADEILLYEVYLSEDSANTSRPNTSRHSCLTAPSLC